MKNRPVTESSPGTWPAPFCESPWEPADRRSGSAIPIGQASAGIRFAVGVAIVALLLLFVGVTSLLQFGAFSRRTEAPMVLRLVEAVEATGQDAVLGARQ